MNSAIYTGVVAHERLRPKRHRLRYRVFSLLLDLDDLPRLDRSLRLLRHNRPGLLSFRDADHGDGRSPLREWAADRLRENSIDWDGGRIALLCYPRVLGYVFNPLTVWFCRNRDGRLVATIYEVHNTYRERHAYVLPAGEDPVLRQACQKAFFVSPFVPMAARYRFSVVPPTDRVAVSIAEDDAEGLLLNAAFAGRRRRLDDAGLLRAVLAHPLMTIGVTVAIHWQALQLLVKGLRVHHKPRRTPG